MLIIIGVIDLIIKYFVNYFNFIILNLNLIVFYKMIIFNDYYY